jgi:hypothetical protein
VGRLAGAAARHGGRCLARDAESRKARRKLTTERRAEIHNAEAAAEELAKSGHTDRRCLVCSGDLVVEEIGASYLVRCKNENRVITTSRGI